MGIFTKNPTATMTEESAASYHAVAAPYGALRVITASAEKIRLDRRGEVERLARRRSGEQWQSLAWEYYDAIGEVKYAFSLLASVCSRIRLYVGFIEEDGKAPVHVENAEELDERTMEAAKLALEELFKSTTVANMIRDLALNLSVTGEGYLVHEPARRGDGVPDKWSIMSIDQLRVNGVGAIEVRRSRTVTSKETIPKSTFVGRIWRQHPRYSDDSDSSMRGILELCDELLLLNRAARAIEKSRLNAGAMYLPDGLSLAGGPGVTGETTTAEGGVETAETTDEDDEFEREFMLAMTTPISDEESPSAVVPLLIRGPAELGDKIKQFKFDRAFDEAMNARAERVLERILTGIDVPKDVITGLANIKYSNAVQITESMYRSHIEPLALLICDSLSQVYLRPVVRAMDGVYQGDIRRLVVWYDPSEIVIKPDRSASSDAGYDRMLLSGESWRTTHGFSEDDRPSNSEVLLRLALTRGQLSPEVTEALLKRIDPKLMEVVREESLADSPAPLPGTVQDVLEGGQPTGTGEPAEPAPSPASGPSGDEFRPPGRPTEPAKSINPRAPLEERTTAPIS